MTVDLLAFGPHPDDIEIGVGGTIAKQVRLAEARAGAAELGVAWRENLEWPDGEIGGGDQVKSAVELIRRCRPATVLVPHWTDRHPDHVAASQILTTAVFKCGLRKYDVAGDAWRPDWVCYYFINDGVPPSFVVDVSEDYDIKRRALDCHRSQFRAGRRGRRVDAADDATVSTVD